MIINVERPNYLNFKEQLIQICVNQYTLILILILLEMFLFKKSLINSLKSLNEISSKSIDQINQYNEKIMNLPNEYSLFINQLIQDNIYQMKTQSLYLVILMINIIIGIIKFIINLYLGTYICLFDGLISGFIVFGLDLVEDILKAANTIIQASTKIISTALSGITSLISDFTSGINSISNFFTNQDSVNSTISIDNINGAVTDLNNFSFPNSIYTELENLKDKIPNFEELEDDTIKKLQSPLTSLILSINDSLEFKPTNYTNISVPVTSYSSINNDDINNFFNKSENIIEKGFEIILIILIIISVLTIGVLILKEYFSWKRKYEFYTDLSNLNNNDGQLNDFKFLNLLNLYSNNFIYYAKKTFKFNDKNIWLISFITSKYSLALFGLSLAGFLSILLQFCLYKVFKDCLKDFPINNLTSNISNSLTKNTDVFVTSTNDYINNQELLLNNELFGSIKNISGTFSDVIGDFVVSLNETIVEPFVDTPFASTINTVVYCVITRKLIMVEQGLEWIQDNLHMSFPNLPSNFENDFNKLMNQQSIGDLVDLQPYIIEVENFYLDSILVKLYICLGIFGLWLFQLCLGLSYYFYKNSTTLIISEPRILTNVEKNEYGYRFDDPQKPRDVYLHQATYNSFNTENINRYSFEKSPNREYPKDIFKTS